MNRLRLFPVIMFLIIVGLAGTVMVEWLGTARLAKGDAIEVDTHLGVNGEMNLANPYSSQNLVYLPVAQNLPEGYRWPSMSCVSVDTSGQQANGNSNGTDMTTDGRFVVFDSEATNLVPNDSNGVPDVFIHDRQTGETTRVSIGANGTQGNGASFGGKVSADGRFVTFTSDAASLISNDTNAKQDIFIHDRQTGETSLISVATAGAQSNGDSTWADISADGRYVVFVSLADNLVMGDGHQGHDVFLHDRQTNQTLLISNSPDGSPMGGNSPTIAADGRFTAFSYGCSIYYYDHQLGDVQLAYRGQCGWYGAEYPEISGDGNFIVFETSVSDDPATRYYLVRYDRQADKYVGFNGNLGPWFVSSPHYSNSPDGRYVAFGDRQVYLLDFLTDEVEPLSTNLSGENGNGQSVARAISADGRIVMMESVATDLVPNDTNSVQDVFIRDRGTP